MKNILVTGGAGFIGRWLVKELLDDGNNVVILDNLSNGDILNIEEFRENKNLKFIKGDIQDNDILAEVFKDKFDIIYHLASSISVQKSIDNPVSTFYNDTIGTLNILEWAKKQMFGGNSKMNGDGWSIKSKESLYPCKVIFMSSCMVYDECDKVTGIDELAKVKGVSPFEASKLAAENLVLSYYNTYKLPTVVIRCFNTYGPYQKNGGVMAAFINSVDKNNDINIYGSGKQTRDLLYVKDCVRLVKMAGDSEGVNGEIINVGTGVDISINELAKVISKNKVKINHIKHLHPQAENMKLLCDYSKAKKLLNWKPIYTIEVGVKETTEWIITNRRNG